VHKRLHRFEIVIHACEQDALIAERNAVIGQARLKRMTKTGSRSECSRPLKRYYENPRAGHFKHALPHDGDWWRNRVANPLTQIFQFVKPQATAQPLSAVIIL
jgi:hypothetical protein